jgi:hypothetical protein
MVEPWPPWPYESAPGFAFAVSNTPFSVSGCEGWATRKNGIMASIEIGARSLSGWYGMLG